MTHARTLEIITNNITIANPEMFTIQLGNAIDTHGYTPSAPAVIVIDNENGSGYALAKCPDGTFETCWFTPGANTDLYSTDCRVVDPHRNWKRLFDAEIEAVIEKMVRDLMENGFTHGWMGDTSEEFFQEQLPYYLQGRDIDKSMARLLDVHFSNLVLYCGWKEEMIPQLVDYYGLVKVGNLYLRESEVSTCECGGTYYSERWERDCCGKKNDWVVKMEKEKWEKRMESIVSKINALKSPLTKVELAIWFAKAFTNDEFAIMEKFEVEVGEDEANKWMCEQLVKTGHFIADNDGFVAPVYR